MEQRGRGVHAGDDQHRVGGERVPAADQVHQRAVARIVGRHLEQVEDHIAAHPDVGDAEPHRDDQQRIEQPVREARDEQQQPVIDRRQCLASRQSPGEPGQQHNAER